MTGNKIGLLISEIEESKLYEETGKWFYNHYRNEYEW